MDIKGLGPMDAGANSFGADKAQKQVQEADAVPMRVDSDDFSPMDVVKGADKDQVISLAQEAVDHLNDMMKDMSKDLRFHLFVDGTDFAYVEVVNPETNEVVKEIPPEELIEAMIKIHDAVGMIIDKYI